eukprot:5825442-Prymnesium_polylepis.1
MPLAHVEGDAEADTATTNGASPATVARSASTAAVSAGTSRSPAGMRPPRSSPLRSATGDLSSGSKLGDGLGDSRSPLSRRPLAQPDSGPGAEAARPGSAGGANGKRKPSTTAVA